MDKVRFIVDTNVMTGNKGIWDRVTDEEYYDNWDELVSLMNELHEENQDIKTGTYINAKNTIKELKEENTHIKNTIQTMIKNERTAIGQSVLQQLWEQIQ